MAVYGIDIGGTKIETAIFDNNLNLLKSWRVNTPTKDYLQFLETIKQQIQYADDFSAEKCNIGIGMPGLINNQGKVLSANVPCATNKHIVKDLLSILERPISLNNDTRCFALSEATLGAGEGFSRVFGAIIGTGAAGGMCIDGKLETTSQGIAGEYGHLPLSAQLQSKYSLPVLICGCGLTGCVESYVSGPGITRLYSHFTNQPQSAKYWSEQLKNGDAKAKQILNCYVDILGQTFAALVKLQEPDVIVLGGGLSLVEAIVVQLPHAISAHLFGGFLVPKVVSAKFGDSSGVRGAAILGMQNYAK